jgi:hypothetical protein
VLLSSFFNSVPRFGAPGVLPHYTLSEIQGATKITFGFKKVNNVSALGIWFNAGTPDAIRKIGNEMKAERGGRHENNDQHHHRNTGNHGTGIRGKRGS